MSDPQTTQSVSKRSESVSHDGSNGSITINNSIEGSLAERESTNDLEINPLSNVLEFDYSFGYDCKQHFNLCVVDENVLIFYSGTLIHIFYLEKNTFEFRKSYSGSGIGHIATNPKEKHLAVGEKGLDPLIVVYEWPLFNVVSKMQGGTMRGYSHLGYSPDGAMLVSQGKEPDHTITIWDWGREQIILRVKSHGQDVFNVEFSQFVPGQLTTCGLGHIKFWKMANTFTGLKLQGELGRFGKTEICDILGICAMPDEKVISGSEWGNILAWDDRLIKLEVRQKAKGNCHNAGISQINFNAETQDIITVGMDGWIKLWTRATIDSADPPDEENWCLEMQPSFELQVKDYLHEAKLMSLCKKNSDPDDVDWYAQDAEGGIWSVSLHADRGAPERLMSCHAGSVADMAASPVSNYLATLGNNGCLLVHDVLKRELLLSKKFKAQGHALIWLPLHVEASGAVLVGGFGDGVLRMFVISLRELQRSKLSKPSISFKKPVEYINIIQLVKAHSAAVTVISLNPRGSILVSGSEDKTIFIHQILPKREYVILVPVGFVEFPAPISHITWMPKTNAIAVISCSNGSINEVALPEKALSISSVTYNLSLDKRTLVFKSIKSELLRAEELLAIERKKQEKLERKKVDLEKVKSENPNLDIDEELFLMDSDEETEFPPLYYPETPSSVLFVMLLPDNNLTVSMGGYDCGYLYQYNLNTLNLTRSDPVPKALNVPIQCFLPICDQQVMAFGMANGVIRLVSCEDGVPNMNLYYDLPMHDPENGKIQRLCTNSSGSYLYSCGTDGNIFTYRLNLDNFTFGEKPQDSLRGSRTSRRTITSISGSLPSEIVIDKLGEEEPSLEELKKNADRLNQEKLANERKEAVLKKLFRLQLVFQDILERNEMLPESQVLKHSTFELDPRITAALQEKIEADKALMMRQIAFKVARSRMLVKKMQNHFVDKIASLDITVRAIKNEALRVKAFTHNKLTREFLQHEMELQTKLKKGSLISIADFEIGSRGTGSIVTIPRQSMIESMQRIQPFYHKLTLKARKALMKRNAQRAKKDRREKQWQMFLEIKPDIKADDPADIAAFEHAIQTIGDFKLKSSSTYKVPEDMRTTPAQKYWQMLCLQREIFETKEAFNKKVCNVRDSKIYLVRKFKQLYHDLDVIQKELRPELQKERLPIPTCYLKNNFPEHIFRLEFGADPTIYYPVSVPYDEAHDILRVKADDSVLVDVVSLDLTQWQDSFTYQRLTEMGADDNIDTPWEHELKVVRLIRLLHEQDMLIKEMKDGVNNFDETLESLSIDRLKYARDIKVMEIFLLTLHQELIVINSYADQEDEMMRRINTCTQLRNDKLRQKVTIQDSIETKGHDVALWQTKLLELQEDLAQKLLNNKFSNFLNRIYKKKRVVKRTEDSESESSSSEDETDEEFEDDDNEDFVPIKLDENVCPEGCDPRLYDDVINSRNMRYDIEDCMLELRKQLDDHQRELIMCNKDLQRLEADLQMTHNESEALQFEKQQKLNNVETLVVLNLSQFCHFVNASQPEEGLVPDPLVFHSEALVTLAGRVRQLHKEIETEQLKLQQQKMLMQRLNKKRREMVEIKKNLLTEIDNEILAKFGEYIDVDQMEEDVLKKMINQARRDFQVDNLRAKYDKMVAHFKDQLWHHTEAMIQVEKENTRRLKLQTMLEQETMKLKELLRHQKHNKEKIISMTELKDCEEDVKRLQTVLECQEEIRQQLREEIRNLSYKSTPPIKQETFYKKVSGGGDTNAGEESEISQEELIMEEPTRKEELEEQISEENMAMIDNILNRLASGSSAYDTAIAIVEELLHFTEDKPMKSSALECALQLVEELLQITTGEDNGDVTLVEQYTDQLLRISKTSNLLDVVDFEQDPTEVASGDM